MCVGGEGAGGVGEGGGGGGGGVDQCVAHMSLSI